MPRGIPKNKPVVTPKKVEKTPKPIANVEKKIEVAEKEKPIEQAKEEKEIKKVDVLIKKDAPKAEKLEPLQPGQKYFEAPDGTHIIGEADKQQVWYRKMNNGKGGWINPKR